MDNGGKKKKPLILIYFCSKPFVKESEPILQELKNSLVSLEARSQSLIEYCGEDAATVSVEALIMNISEFLSQTLNACKEIEAGQILLENQQSSTNNYSSTTLSRRSSQMKMRLNDDHLGNALRNLKQVKSATLLR